MALAILRSSPATRRTRVLMIAACSATNRSTETLIVSNEIVYDNYENVSVIHGPVTRSQENGKTSEKTLVFEILLERRRESALSFLG